MDTQAIIDEYVNKVAANLPRRLRNDVGLELRTLLTEQLGSAAAAAGRAPDRETAMDVLRRFGRPDEVAARYAPRGFQLIEPEYSPVFLKLATLAVAIQWAVTLPAVFSSHETLGNWAKHGGLSALSWVGVLLVWFGIASWIQRRSPADPDSGTRPRTHWIFWVPFPGEWRPSDPEGTQWRAARNAAPLGAVLTLFFIAPAWILGHLVQTQTDTSWALYDERFKSWLLPLLIALMAVRVVVFAVVALNERRRAASEALRFGLWVGFVAALYWALFSGPIFANGITDALFKGWLLVFLLINTIQIVVWIRRTATRVRIPKTLVPH
ncbi:MAG: hypothetical protein WDM77_18240 [Steroidobacteraceae bacterium]